MSNMKLLCLSCLFLFLGGCMASEYEVCVDTQIEIAKRKALEQGDVDEWRVIADVYIQHYCAPSR